MLIFLFRYPPFHVFEMVIIPTHQPAVNNPGFIDEEATGHVLDFVLFKHLPLGIQQYLDRHRMLFKKGLQVFGSVVCNQDQLEVFLLPGGQFRLQLQHFIDTGGSGQGKENQGSFTAFDIGRYLHGLAAAKNTQGKSRCGWHGCG